MNTRKSLKTLSIILSTVLIFLAFSVFSYAVDNEDYQNTGVSETPLDVAQGVQSLRYVEDVSKREENVKHFLMPDGTYTAVAYPNAVHRMDSNGVWQDINNDLTIKSVNGKQRYSTDDNRFTFSSGLTLNDVLVTLTDDDYTLSISPLSNTINSRALSSRRLAVSTPTVANAEKKDLTRSDITFEEVAEVNNQSSIQYNNVYESANIEYTVCNLNQLTQKIQIWNPYLNSYQYHFELVLGTLTAELNSSGGINIKDALTNEIKLVLQKPYMYEFGGCKSDAVEYTLSQSSSGTYLLTVTADNTWINQFLDGNVPITIDMKLSPITLCDDTYVSEYAPDEYYFMESELLVGYGKTALIHLNMPTLPTGSHMVNANLFFNYYFTTTFSESPLIGAYQIMTPWSESVTTYNSMPTIATEQISSVSLSMEQFSENTVATAAISLTELAYDWYNDDVENYGIALKYEMGTFDVHIKSYETGVNNCEFLGVNYCYDILPLSGYELDYNPDFWNSGENIVEAHCYQYMLNTFAPAKQNVPDDFYRKNPGFSAGITYSREDITAELIISATEEDSEVIGFTFTPVQKNTVCPQGTYKVALVIGEGYDYHWYRQNSDGSWSHKRGGTEVTNIDSSYNIIYDPETSQRAWDTNANLYPIFAGYFAVSPVNANLGGNQ